MIDEGRVYLNMVRKLKRHYERTAEIMARGGFSVETVARLHDQGVTQMNAIERAARDGLLFGEAARLWRSVKPRIVALGERVEGLAVMGGGNVLGSKNIDGR